MQLPMMDYDRQNVIPLAAWPSEPACLLGRVLVDRDLLSLLSGFAWPPGLLPCAKCQQSPKNATSCLCSCRTVASLTQ